MIETGFDARVKIHQIVQNQIPEFLLSESPKSAEFLKQYYISQEYQGGSIDIVENLDQYLKVDNLTKEIIRGETVLKNSITETSNTILVDSTKGFPSQYGLLKIDDEIITYTGLTTNTFTGCVRGFSGITTYHQVNEPDELLFSSSSSQSHVQGTTVKNLSSLFLQEFFKNIKYTYTPGLENVSFTPELNPSLFIKEAKSLYQSKGTEESFKILFKVLYNEDVKIVDLEQFLSKPSAAKFSRREIIIAERISGNPINLVGQTIKKSTDETTQGSISEVEIITRKGKSYYKISLFIGYNDDNLTEGNFTIPGTTKVLETVSIGSSIISVDSTIGFGQTGTLVFEGDTISYSNKSINQFFGCSGIKKQISIASTVRSDEVVYGYENGDITKKVELRITGVISDFIPVGDILLAKEGETIGVKNVGEKIENPKTKTLKQVFANSWIYNTSSRYQIASISDSSFTLLSEVDKSSLKIGDYVDILKRNTQDVVYENAQVSNIISEKEITLTGIGGFTPQNIDYDLRRRIKKTSSSGVLVEYGNNKIIADVQNVYTDREYGYVASNSLPSYTINKNIVESSISEANGSRLQNYNALTLKYSVISFTNEVPFITGDEVIYEPEKTAMPGLVAGNSYFVQVLDETPKRKIRLYVSRSFIGGTEFSEFGELPTGSGYHKFILKRHEKKYVGPQNLLRKFSLIKNDAKGNGEKTSPGGIGLLVNGVELVSPTSNDKIYYGPIESVKVLNSGDDYDVINPPQVEISSPLVGTKALVRPVLSGSVSSILVDPQDFDIDKVVSVTISGGNGIGAILKPIVSKRFREVEFDGRLLANGGGVDITNETISFSTIHNFVDGQTVIYNSNGNAGIGVGTYFSFNTVQSRTLVNGSEYYVKVINSSTIKLYQNINDYFVGVNTVGFTTENTGGVHKFRTLETKTLRDIKVLDGGKNYQNRQLYVKSSGISTQTSTITFENHNFSDGDIIEYKCVGIGTSVASVSIPELSTSKNYYVLKLDNNRFRLAEVETEQKEFSNYVRKNFVKFSSSGSGYHIFKYPDIQLTINVSFGSSVVGIITATPVIRGKIIDAYLYEKGSGYGSEIINFPKKPKITVKTGKNAEISPIIKNGKIISVKVLSGGSEYYSIPSLKITGKGTGAILRPIISNGKLVDVIIINSGTGYEQDNTSIKVVPAGSGAFIDCSIRSLTLNEQFRYESENLRPGLDNLEYSIVGYSTSILSEVLNDDGSAHSPIIGWAYDGNPIYGPYGHSDPEDISSPIRLIRSGYELNTSNIENRPSSFDPGFFIEDYSFKNTGDLDIHNGRFCKTEEFPNGVYAYFAGIGTDLITQTLKPVYPYFIGESYRSILNKENFILNQSFDFNNSNLIRNTFPYKVGDPYAGNDFITESNELINQQTVIESITRGSVENINILESGDGYKVGENAIFDDSGTDGGGLSAEIEEITGKKIDSVSTLVDEYSNSVLIWKDKETVEAYVPQYHIINNNEYVILSGLTTSISKLSKTHQVGVTTENVILFKSMGSVLAPNTVEDIYVSSIPSSVSIGSTILIENEFLYVLNVYNEGSILRVRRSDSGVAHTASTLVNILPNKISIPVKTSYFNSTLNDKVFFNPKQSVGVGSTAGVSSLINYTVGETTKNISISNQSIYLPNHPFKTGQRVVFSKKTGTSSLLCSDTPQSAPFNLPLASNSALVYIINKSKDYIGITTSVGLTTNTDGLYFLTNGTDNYEYNLESSFAQVTADLQKIKATVSISTAHGLKNGDIVTLKVRPNTQSGIGNSSSVRVVYNAGYNRILINPISFNGSGINTSTSQITLDASYLNTGDKVFYNSTNGVASGLTTGFYYVYKIDNNTIKLAETYYDSTLQYPNTINISSVGGNGHKISLVNPQVNIIRNCDLVFDLSDPSLVGKKLKIFYDNNFNNEFVSTGSEQLFNTSGIGTVGVSSTSKLIIKYSEGLPSKLYYTLEDNGNINFVDNEVRNASEILFVDSVYNGTYTTSNVTETTFNITLNGKPEKTLLLPVEQDTLEYSTKSLFASGGISKLKIIFPGYNYKKLPAFVGFSSSGGKNANIILKSNSIGKINNTRILNSGFEYSSDKTLRPEADISQIIEIKNSSTIIGVDILDGGKNYISAPNIVVVDPETGEVVNKDSLTCSLTGNSITSVNIDIKPNGLSSKKQRIVTIDNSNGVAISSITSSRAGIITCTLATPLVGFSTNIFTIGEEIFVEGIQKNSIDGSGFNSENYGYKFFTVSNYQNTNPAIVEFSLSGITTNAGIAKTYQDGYASIISKKNYPVLDSIQDFSYFIVGEKLLTSLGNKPFIERDLTVSETTSNYVKVKGTYTLSENEILRGKNSGVLSTVDNIIKNTGLFEVDYALKQNYGWISDTGKLSELFQVTSDNDYYQNLSYSVRSSIEYENLINPVNSLLHPSGLKNFADTQIESKSDVKVAYGATTNDIIVLDIVDNNRVDTINNIDLAIDIDSLNEFKTKTIKFREKRLTDYIKCLTNRALVIDDVSGRFSNRESNPDTFVNLDSITDTYSKYFVQVKNANNSDRQIYEIVSLSNTDNVYLLEKGTLSNTNISIGDITSSIDETGKNLRFIPTEVYDDDYDIKLSKSTFNSNSSGIGTYSVGFVNLTGINKTVGIGTTQSLISIPTNKFEGLFASVHITNTVTNDMDYVELFLTHDNINSYQADFYFDSSNSGNSSGYSGRFDSTINSGIFSLNYYNDEKQPVLVSTKIVGFGTTSVGSGVYRFLSSGQPSGSENSARFESNYAVSQTESTIISVENTVSSLKSLIKVSYGNTSALHQVLMIQDNADVYTLQYPFLSIGSTSGIGTFGGTLSGSNVLLKFYPDPAVNAKVQIQSFNEILYSESDYSNIPLSLEYGTSTETFKLSAYDGINGSRANRLDFDANYNGVPIYKKTFNPFSTSILSPDTGIFTIKDHFFSTGEELKYTPGSTFVGIAATSVGIGATLNNVGVVTNILPSTVYAIKINNDEFKLATRKNYADVGIFVTFTGYGSGNAHSLEMVRKLDKTVISLDNVVQKPITFVPFTYSLQSNGGQINASNTYISISGISSIKPRDILKIDNEYMNVVRTGIGTSYNGPISGIGTYNLVLVTRGFVGTSATSHIDGSNVNLYRGSYNIDGNKIYFTSAPKGAGKGSETARNSSNLLYPRTAFNGRVFLRNDYSTNILYDDLSDQFTGIGQTYRLSVQGINTSGIQTGSGILFLNEIFQTPTTFNNSGNNYELTGSSGISSVRFTGITSSNGQIIIAENDIVQNQLPRGGIIVSLGSTPGAGFAPLVGAKVKAIVGAGGSITRVTGIAYTGTGNNVSTAFYNNRTGIVEITTNTNHGLSNGDFIKLTGLGFTCPSSPGITSYFPLTGLSGSYSVSGIISTRTFTAYVGPSTLPHTYVGMGTIFPWYNLNYGSGYRDPVSIGITDPNHTGTQASISVAVGAGGTLSFVVNSGGSGYSTSTVLVNVSDPSYENLPVIGVSRPGIGSTTETGKNLLVTLDVGAISTTGIGSTLFEVSSFKISRPGYGFKIGDVFRPVGLVTASGLNAPIANFELTVLDTFTDSFSFWQFGELDYIDSIKNLQDGIRRRFPLYYNGQLLSFEKDPRDSTSVTIDLNAVLLIFINGIIQQPGSAYQFEGGTSFLFSSAPKPEDNVSIFFYRGSRDVDSKSIDIQETIKIGDSVQISKNNDYPNTISQDIRRIDNIPGSDKIDTNIYTGLGIDQTIFKPISWIKQKSDLIVNGEYIYKSRDSLESQIYPSAKIIKTINSGDSEIFVDDARFFNYEENNYSIAINDVDGIIVQGTEAVAAAMTAIVSTAGTISSLSIENPGSGYEYSSATVKIAPPKQIGVGIGTRAEANVTILNGLIASSTITNPGFGYTIPPQVIVSSPSFKVETIENISVVQGFSGIITGISPTTGTLGNPLAIKFFINAGNAVVSDLTVGYPFVITNTSVGAGVTSVDSSQNSIVGIGTSYLNNIYIAHQINTSGSNIEIISNVKSNTNILGITTVGITSSPLGRFSWGKLSGIKRSISPVSIGVSGLTVDSGLSTFPTIQRRGFGLRNTGAIRKQSNA